ncbi:MAG: helix-turn-helix domain-containing protein [Candidatus Margulisbacteria bacterium]|jgi:transcriptional regulator with XRE-family HTH domain|nr:helix-turn-helix domain-containing protein [Candidatus Margulisiibacteriota bacterium]
MAEEDLQKILSNNIKLYRVRLKWSQEKLAEKADTSVTFISGLETGRKWVSPHTLNKLARAFGIKGYELLKPDDVLPQDYSSLLSKYSEEVCAAAVRIRERYLARRRPFAV